MRAPMFALALLAVACAPTRFDPSDPPDRFTEADAACVGDARPGPYSEVSEECADVVADVFNDPDEILQGGEVAQLRLGVDPYLFDLEAFYVTEIRLASADDRWLHEGHLSRWDLGDSAIVVYGEYLEDNADPVEEAMVLAHEVGHGRPGGYAHRTCRTGQFEGEKLCDRWTGGAIDTSLWFLEDAAFPGQEDKIARLRDITRAQLEL